MEDIVKEKVDQLRIYYFLQEIDSHISLFGIDYSKNRVEEFVEDDMNLLRFFSYFTRNSDNVFIPSFVARNMEFLVTPEMVRRFIALVPNTVLRYKNDPNLEGPCSLRYIFENMFPHSSKMKWYDYAGENAETFRKVFNWIKLKFPHDEIDKEQHVDYF